MCFDPHLACPEGCEHSRIIAFYPHGGVSVDLQTNALGFLMAIQGFSKAMALSSTSLLEGSSSSSSSLEAEVEEESVPFGIQSTRQYSVIHGARTRTVVVETKTHANPEKTLVFAMCAPRSHCPEGLVSDDALKVFLNNVQESIQIAVGNISDASQQVLQLAFHAAAQEILAANKTNLTQPLSVLNNTTAALNPPATKDLHDAMRRMAIDAALSQKEGAAILIVVPGGAVSTNAGEEQTTTNTMPQTNTAEGYVLAYGSLNTPAETRAVLALLNARTKTNKATKGTTSIQPCVDSLACAPAPAWRIDSDGIAVGNTSSPPIVHVTNTSGELEAHVLLVAPLPRPARGVLLVALVPVASALDGLPTIRSAVAASATRHAADVGRALREHRTGGKQGGHVPGYRYLVVDELAGISYGSPAVKLGTLATDSLRAVSRVRSYAPEAHEVCARAGHDCWVVKRRSPQDCREVTVCLEKAGDTLLEAREAAVRLVDNML